MFCFNQHYFRPYVSHGIIVAKMVAEEKMENWIYILRSFGFCGFFQSCSVFSDLAWLFSIMILV